MIGSKFSRHFFNQSEVKPKPIVARASTFSRALYRLRLITSSFDWFTGFSPSFLIGQSNYFGFGFTTLDWNSFYQPMKRKTKTNGDFPALWASYMDLLRIWIGSLCCLHVLWLVEVITLVTQLSSVTSVSHFFHFIEWGKFWKLEDWQTRNG